MHKKKGTPIDAPPVSPDFVPECKVQDIPYPKEIRNICKKNISNDITASLKTPKRKHRKLIRRSLKAFVPLSMTCILTLSGCTGQYNVLERVADTKTEGEPIETETEAEESSSSDNTSSINNDTAAEEDLDSPDTYIGERPEYDPLKYVDVSQCDIKDIKLNSKDIVSDEDVDEYIHELMIKEGKYADNTEAKRGDIVNIDYTASDGSEVIADIHDEDRYVGNNTFPDEVDKKLEGTKAGDNIIVKYTYPEDYSDELYKGRTVTFNIKINAVHGMEITDEVFQAIGRGNGENVKEYKQFIKKFLTYNKIQDISDKAVDELCEKAEIKSYPADVVKYDVQKEFIKFYQDNKIDGTDSDAFNKLLKEKGYKDEADFAESIQDEVKKNLEQEMKVLALAKKYKLWLSDDNLSEVIMKQITGFESAEDYYSTYSKYHAQYCLARINLAKEIQKNEEKESTG